MRYINSNILTFAFAIFVLPLNSCVHGNDGSRENELPEDTCLEIVKTAMQTEAELFKGKRYEEIRQNYQEAYECDPLNYDIYTRLLFYETLTKNMQSALHIVEDHRSRYGPDLVDDCIRLVLIERVYGEDSLANVVCRELETIERLYESDSLSIGTLYQLVLMEHAVDSYGCQRLKAKVSYLRQRMTMINPSTADVDYRVIQKSLLSE